MAIDADVDSMPAAFRSLKLPENIPQIGAEQVLRCTPMPALIDSLRAAFQTDWCAPPRVFHEVTADTLMMLMLGWRAGGPMGVKITLINRRKSPSVCAHYLLLDPAGGAPMALIDGSMLTSRRTAAASALAASYLARANANTLLMIGTGALAPHMIEAHVSVRPINKVLLWGRNKSKLEALAHRIRALVPDIEISPDIDRAISQADIISAATTSSKPFLKGRLLRNGTHVDLVGAFRKDMAEADAETFRRARVFVDHRPSVLEEAGDLLSAIDLGAIAAESIEADLSTLCRGLHGGRDHMDEITVFKSVGVAVEDLAAAELTFDVWRRDPLTKFQTRLAGTT